MMNKVGVALNSISATATLGRWIEMRLGSWIDTKNSAEIARALATHLAPYCAMENVAATTAARLIGSSEPPWRVVEKETALSDFARVFVQRVGDSDSNVAAARSALVVASDLASRRARRVAQRN